MADESCDFAVVRALREAGHDVLYISEADPGAEDDAVVARAYADGRVAGEALWFFRPRSVAISASNCALGPETQARLTP